MIHYSFWLYMFFIWIILTVVLSELYMKARSKKIMDYVYSQCRQGYEIRESQIRKARKKFWVWPISRAFK